VRAIELDCKFMLREALYKIEVPSESSLKRSRSSEITMADIVLRPFPKLSPEQVEQINDALVDAFDLAELSRMLLFKWGIILANYINVRQGNSGIVSDLIEWTERRGKTRDFIAIAYAQNPGNPSLQQVAQSLGLTLPEVREKYDPTKALLAKPPLEAMVARHSRFINYNKFLARFRSLGDRVCRIETPYTLGTGFLVGPNLVLTNFHVIESVTTLAQAAQCVCQFDHREDSQGGAATGSVSAHFDREWLIAKRRYSNSDVLGVGEAAIDELDYALIRLKDNIGSMPVYADKHAARTV